MLSVHPHECYSLFSFFSQLCSPSIRHATTHTYLVQCHQIIEVTNLFTIYLPVCNIQIPFQHLLLFATVLSHNRKNSYIMSTLEYTWFYSTPLFQGNYTLISQNCGTEDSLWHFRSSEEVMWTDSVYSGPIILSLVERVALSRRSNNTLAWGRNTCKGHPYLRGFFYRRFHQYCIIITVVLEIHVHVCQFLMGSFQVWSSWLFYICIQLALSGYYAQQPDHAQGSHKILCSSV